jgi:hypothetical protein
MHWLRGGVVLLAALAFLGCGDPPPPDQSDDTRLAESIDVDIADWLDKPRSDLADLVDDKTEYLRQNLEQQRSNAGIGELLPDLKPALSPPLFRTVKYSKKLNVSLPTYLAEDVKDREVAWHLARHGDVDAAKKIADPTELGFSDKLEQLRYDRNYPVEWTRLVALHLFDAELKLARGDTDGASEIVHLHRQLEKVLDPKAKAGPLGAALLPIGRRALTLASSAYREAPYKMNLLADDIDAALKDWKDVPPPQAALGVGADKHEVARFFRKPQQGHVFAATGSEAGRALDLLALPVPSEDVDGVVAFLDRGDRLAEMIVYYHSNMRQNYPKPVNVAHHLVDGGSAGTELAESPGVLRQTYLAGGQAYQVMVLTNVSSGSAATSALIRIGDAKGGLAEPSLPANPRDLGDVHLDRSFDQNRLSLDASMKPAAQVETSRVSAIDRVQQPIRDPRPSSIALTKDADADLLASVAIRWPSDLNKDAVAKLLLPLFARFGSGRIEGVEDAKGGHLAFTWESDVTRYTFHLPYIDGNPPELVVSDRRGADGIAQRKEAAATFDQDQRKTRLREGREKKRLDPWLDPKVTNVSLGMTKADALERLPQSQRFRQTKIADGISIYFLEPPVPLELFTPRQMWIRFGTNDRVAEIRIRYVEAAGKSTKSNPSLTDWLTREPHGAPETLTSTWSGLWTDLPKKTGTPVLYRWRDDVTIMTYERDAGGSEVTIRDCPLDQPNGVQLPPLQYCSRGVDHCKLGDARADVPKHWPGDLQKTPDDGVVLGQPKTSPYDLVVVWFENEKVSRIVARHRQKGALNYNDVPKALQEAWSRDLDTLGVIRRQDAPVGQVLQGYGWHDDVTRVRIFGQDSADGPRLLTEWRDWPVAVKAPK